MRFVGESITDPIKGAIIINCSEIGTLFSKETNKAYNKDFVRSINTDFHDGDICVYKDKEYYYENKKWVLIEKETKKMKKLNCYYISNIDWDTDGEDVKLPKTMIIVSEYDLDENELSERITNKTGFCHNGFYHELLTDTRIEDLSRRINDFWQKLWECCGQTERWYECRDYINDMIECYIERHDIVNNLENEKRNHD